MLVANANQDDSKIVQFTGACRSMQNLKAYRDIVPQGTPGLDHPYGLATDGRYLFVSTQGSNAIFRYANKWRSPHAPGLLGWSS